LSSLDLSPVTAVLLAKSIRTFCYGFLGILLPVYLADHGMSATGIGLAVTCTLVGSAGLTWAVRRPAERLGARAALSALAVLSALSAEVVDDPALNVPVDSTRLAESGELRAGELEGVRAAVAAFADTLA